MPVAAEVDGLALLLHHLEDEGKAVDACDEGVWARLAEPRADFHDVGGLEALVADHEDRIAEERVAHFLPAALCQARQVDAADLGAERTGNGLHVHAASLALMIRPWPNA